MIGVDFIDDNREEFGVEPICTVLRSAGVSLAPSTYYAAKSRGPSQRAQRDAVLGPALVQLWKDNYCVYGAHKLWKTARRAGHDVGRDQVGRLMRAAGIEGVRRGKRVRTTKPDPGAGRHPDLVKRNFTATAPNQLWVTDLTYVPTWAGVAYVCFITDAFSRITVGWRGRVEHADHDGARRDRDGPLVTGKYVAGLDMSLRRRIAIHVRSLR